jgi:hypothetical protein
LVVLPALWRSDEVVEYAQKDPNLIYKEETSPNIGYMVPSFGNGVMTQIAEVESMNLHLYKAP